LFVTKTKRSKPEHPLFISLPSFTIKEFHRNRPLGSRTETGCSMHTEIPQLMLFLSPQAVVYTDQQSRMR